MPKNSKWGENTKAVAARTRKAETADAKASVLARQKDDAEWADSGPRGAAKREEKRLEEERKRAEAEQRRKAAKEQLAEEEASMKSSGAKKNEAAAASKVTQHHILMNSLSGSGKNSKKTSKQGSEVNSDNDDNDIQPNLNRLPEMEGSARNVDDAIAVLNPDGGVDIDLHPEKRAKALFQVFQKRRLDEYKAQKSLLRLSQLKQMIWKEWLKSPENPSNFAS